MMDVMDMMEPVELEKLSFTDSSLGSEVNFIQPICTNLGRILWGMILMPLTSSVFG